MNVKEYQQHLSEVYTKKQKLNKKLGLGIMIWENLDYIFKVCTELRTVFDYIILGWQDKAYDGKELELSEEARNEFQNKLIKLHSLKLIDNVVVVEVNNLNENTFYKECYKRNILSKYLQEEGADYTMIIDCDEFHFAEDILREVNFLEKHNIDCCYTNLKNFIGDFEHIHQNAPNERHNGLCKATSENVFEWNVIPGITTDLTRTFNAKFSKHVFDKIYTYHFSWVRKDISEKLNNYSQKLAIQNPDYVKSQMNNVEEMIKSGTFNINNEKRKISKYVNKKLLEYLKVLDEMEMICGV